MSEPDDPGTLDCGDDCPGCAICHEDDDPKAMGWIGKDGRP